jgi:hypothetical protein
MKNPIQPGGSTIPKAAKTGSLLIENCKFEYNSEKYPIRILEDCVNVTYKNNIFNAKYDSHTNNQILAGTLLNNRFEFEHTATGAINNTISTWQRVSPNVEEFEKICFKDNRGIGDIEKIFIPASVGYPFHYTASPNVIDTTTGTIIFNATDKQKIRVPVPTANTGEKRCIFWKLIFALDSTGNGEALLRFNLYNGETKLKTMNPANVPMSPYGTANFSLWEDSEGHVVNPGFEIEDLHFVLERDGAAAMDTSTNQMRFIGIQAVMARSDNV